MNEIRIEKEIETERLNIVQLKERIETLVAELEAEGFDPKESSLYLYEWKDTLEVTCSRDETPEETAKRVAEEEAERAAFNARRAAAAEQKRQRELEEQMIHQQQEEQTAWNCEAARILAGKTLAELRRMSTI